MASKSKEKPPTSIIPGDESRRRREGTATTRESHRTPNHFETSGQSPGLLQPSLQFHFDPEVVQWSSLKTLQAGGEPIQPANRFQDVSTAGALFDARRSAANTVAFEADSQTLVRRRGGQAVSKRAKPEPSKNERQCSRGPKGTFRKSQQSCQDSD